MQTLEKDLEEIGLTDREAAAYIAVLELGLAPVQKIARRAKIACSTTYLVLESLEQQGLIVRSEDKKTLFRAVAPSQLIHPFLEEERESLLRKMRLLDLIPRLQALRDDDTDKPIFKLFTGEGGLLEMKRLLVMYSKDSDIWRSLIAADAMREVFGDDFLFDPNRLAKNIYAKTIFTTHSAQLRNSLLSYKKHEKVERRFLSPDRYDSPVSILLVRNRLALGTFTKENAHGVMIEDTSIATMALQVFEMLWTSIGRQAPSRGTFSGKVAPVRRQRNA